jgi:hypothetical protein
LAFCQWRKTGRSRTALPKNSYWIAGLVAEGEKFAREMLHDEIGHRQIRGQRLFASGLPLGDQVETRLRSWLRNSAKQFKNAKTLTPKEVALKTAIGKSYIFYEQLSSDAAHPSLDALNRHVIPHTKTEVGGIDVEPIVRDPELADTLEYLCMAVMGVCVGVNQILEGTKGALNGLADQYIALKSRRRAENRLNDQSSLNRARRQGSKRALSPYIAGDSTKCVFLDGVDGCAGRPAGGKR